MNVLQCIYLKMKQKGLKIYTYNTYIETYNKYQINEVLSHDQILSILQLLI